MRQEDPIIPHRRRKIHRGVYLFPSLLTAAALFSGFYSIIFTLQALNSGRSDFQPAVIAILVATFFDSMDGRMARLMKAESEFGFQFDSIADMVSFGVAPAVLVHGFALVDLGRIGWLGAFLFLACAGIRLARFNVISGDASSRKYFKGLPSPVAAGGLSLCTYIAYGIFSTQTYLWVTFSLTAAFALLMISNVRFRSLKDLDFRRHPLQVFLISMLLIVFGVNFPEQTLFLVLVIYLFAGFTEEIILFRRRRKSDPSVPFLPFGDRE